MTVAKQTALYDVVDAKVWPLATDLSGSASPTYGSAIDVPGISAVSLDPSIIANALKGDGKVLRTKSRIEKFAVKATYGLFDADVLAATLGGAIIRNDASEVTYDYVLNGASASLNYFAFGCQVTDTDDELGVADVHLLFYKCKMTGGSLFSQASDSFGQPSLDMDVIGPNAGAGDFRAVRARLLAASTALVMN